MCVPPGVLELIKTYLEPVQNLFKMYLIYFWSVYSMKGRDLFFCYFLPIYDQPRFDYREIIFGLHQ